MTDKTITLLQAVVGIGAAFGAIVVFVFVNFETVQSAQMKDQYTKERLQIVMERLTDIRMDLKELRVKMENISESGQRTDHK